MKMCDELNTHVTYCTVSGHTQFQVCSITPQTLPPKEDSQCLPDRLNCNMAFNCTKSRH